MTSCQTVPLLKLVRVARLCPCWSLFRSNRSHISLGKSKQTLKQLGQISIKILSSPRMLICRPILYTGPPMTGGQQLLAPAVHGSQKNY